MAFPVTPLNNQTTTLNGTLCITKGYAHYTANFTPPASSMWGNKYIKGIPLCNEFGNYIEKIM